MLSISVFLHVAKFADFLLKNADVGRIQEMCYFIHIFFGSSSVRYNCAKFRHCWISVTDFRERGPFGPHPIREQHWKGPYWIVLKKLSLTIAKTKRTREIKTLSESFEVYRKTLGILQLECFLSINESRKSFFFKFVKTLTTKKSV